MSPSWSLRKYREGDEHAIIELLTLAFGYTENWSSLEHWKWRIQKNPAGSPITWLAEHNGKIIGHYSMNPVKMKLGNMYLIGSWASNGAVHPKYQGRGVFSSLVNRCSLDAAESGFPLTYGFANANLGPTYRRYERVGHICFVPSMEKILNWNVFFGRHLHSNYLSSAAAAVLGKMCSGRYENDGVNIERVDYFDERFDDFWEEISRCHKIIVKRDRKYLNWRYAEHPTNKYIIYAALRNHRILGYCILRKGQQSRRKIGFISDILGFQGDSDVVGHLIQKSLEHFEDEQVDKVTCMMSEKHPYRAIFRKAGFITSRARGRARAALYVTVNLPGSAIIEKLSYSQALMLSQNHFLKEKRDWFMMTGDGNWHGE